MNKLVAILPVRNFDYYIDKKNLLPFADTNLLVYKIRQLKKVSRIDDIIICSDDEKLENLSNEENVSFLKREISDIHKDSFPALISSVLNSVKSEHILWANCCTPFVTEEVYNNAINVYEEKIKEKYDSLISVLPFKKFVIDDNGPLNFHKGLRHKETRNLNQLYFWIPAISLAKRKDMISWQYTWGNIPYKFTLSQKEATEIKKADDLYLAELYEEADE